MNNLMKRNPAPMPMSVSPGDPLARIMENMFGDFFAPLVHGAGRLAEEGAAIPRMNVAETDKTYEVDIDMPGVKKDDVKVSVEGHRVMVEADCQQASEQRQGENLLYAERTARKYMRSFTLPTEVDEAGAQAKLDDGILHLTLPKKQPTQPHRLSIQ